MPCACVATYEARSASGLVTLCRALKASYLVVILKYYATYNAFFPDVPGCVATSTNLGEVRKLIAECLQLHLPALLMDGLPLPEPKTREYTELEPEDELVEYGSVHVKVVAE